MHVESKIWTKSWAHEYRQQTGGSVSGGEGDEKEEKSQQIQIWTIK